MFLPDGQRLEYGDPSACLKATLHVLRWRVFVSLMLTESIGLAEAYMDEDWLVDDLTNFVSIAIEQDKAGIVMGRWTRNCAAIDTQHT